MEQPMDSPSNRAPYGKAFGLFAASVVTLIGIVREASPEVVLLRAAVAGLVGGVVVRLVVLAAQHLARDA